MGACVGMKGMRVQSIIRELRGEKIDIIPYSEETVAFAQKALSPAKVTRVQIVDPEEKRLEVIVEDTQLSLAIGKKGQNVRLASKLIGWNIDIKSEEEKRREIEAQMAALTAPGTPLTELEGVGPKTIEKLEARYVYRKARGHDAGATGGDSGHRRKDGGEDSSVRGAISRRWNHKPLPAEVRLLRSRQQRKANRRSGSGRERGRAPKSTASERLPKVRDGGRYRNSTAESLEQTEAGEDASVARRRRRQPRRRCRFGIRRGAEKSAGTD